jgi:putative PEP-CTERM system histidine kinase
MELSFAVIGNSIGAITFLLLAIYIVRGTYRRATDRAILLASALSSAWLAVLCAQALGINIPFIVRYPMELIRTAAWFGVLYAILGIRFIPNASLGKHNLYASIGIIALLSIMISVTLYQQLTSTQIISGRDMLIMQVVVSLIGLLLLEQIWRNAAIFSRSGIKYLTIAVATVFIFDFVMYSDALLFKHLSGALWDARGAINALVTPLLGVTMINSRRQPIGIHVSRQMVFHTSTLIIAGVYLIFVSAGGYYINLFGGTWGEALRVLFLFFSAILLLIFMSSPAMRARFMVFISKNFFTYKYDYREEWIKSTDALQHLSGESLTIRTVKALASLVNAEAGAVWGKNDDGHYVLRDQINLPGHSFELIHSDSDMAKYLTSKNWVINLKEYLVDPVKYDLMELPRSILDVKNPWLIVPLRLDNELCGFVLLCEPFASLDLNWENYDLLKIVAQQASSYIEQKDSQEKLGHARQFEAVTQTSAFLVHDIKTIIAQLSLLVKNAEKHKENPAFVDDMIRTTAHSVEKMEHLLAQIRNPDQNALSQIVDLRQLLENICQERRNSSPAPTLKSPAEELPIQADPSQLHAVIAHITQNAIEACSKSGEVELSTKQSANMVYIFIQDNGGGMSEKFIQEELFKPFSSTKGLTGMGIGAYQSREYLRKISGTISVRSEEGVGTCFTLSIPLASPISEP